jgi:hypothetical protein
MWDFLGLQGWISPLHCLRSMVLIPLNKKSIVIRCGSIIYEQVDDEDVLMMNDIKSWDVYETICLDVKSFLPPFNVRAQFS